MKSFLLSVLFVLPFGNNSLDRLIGEWTVEKVVTANRTILPKTKKYSLLILHKRCLFNLDVNSCGAKITRLTDSTITVIPQDCTQVCCDGSKDTIANFLNYSGKYALYDSLMTITNTKGTIYLVKLLKVGDIDEE